MTYKIGIDIGGTRTHGVLCEHDKAIFTIDVPTTPDTKQCVKETIQKLLNSSHVDPSEIIAVMVGTTRFVNNILENKNLNQVFVIRLGAPSTTAVPPTSDWPLSLKRLVGENMIIINGGYEFTGKEITPINHSEVEAIAKKALKAGIQYIAISGVFSHIRPDQEIEVYKIFKRISPDFHISLSHEIGEPGLLERENATILNAAMASAFESFCAGIYSSLAETKLVNATLYFSSNVGTVENPDEMFPVQTYGSGPSNSIRGAAELITTKSPYLIVADIGGTSTDIDFHYHRVQRAILEIRMKQYSVIFQRH